jgi:membrane-associated phospholipid phosphatase
VTHPHSSLMRVVAPFREKRMPPLDGLGSWEYVLPLSAAIYASGRLAHDASRRDAGLGCAATHLSSAAIREIIYLGVSRGRPNFTSDPRTFSVPGTRPWANHSFLSGHITNAMGCASFLAHRFHVGMAAPAMYVYASAIGAGRIVDGWHWTSDTIAGGVLGYAIGRVVAERQLARAPSASKAAQPSDPLTIGWRITF